MDIKELTSLLCDTLSTERKGVLPGIGTFMLEDVPSEYSEDGNSISAPGKKVVFSPDGAGEANAESAIVVEALNANGFVELPGFGVLRRVESKGSKGVAQTVFEVDKEFIADPDSFGLEDIHLDDTGRIKSTEEVEAEKKARAEAEAKAAQEAEQKRIAEEKAKAETQAKAETEAAQKAEQKRIAEEKAKAEADAKAAAQAKATVKAQQPAAKATKKPAAKAPLSPATKALLWILAVVVILIALAVVIYLFRESLAPYLKQLLYSKEELEILNYKL